MSWSVNAVGKPIAVAVKVAADLANQKCAEPEETIKNAVGEIIAVALAAYADSFAVTVAASGHQSPVYSPTGQPGPGIVNALSLKIEPLYSFVE